MKIYTGRGDGGQTVVIGGAVLKDDARIEAYGTIDELNSCLGFAISLMTDEALAELKTDLLQIQHELFDCGTDLAILKEGEQHRYAVSAHMVEHLERKIDYYTAQTEPINYFILPGGSSLSSALHMCRTICRRAERRIVTLGRQQAINEEVRRYMNRLSDLLFTVARVANVKEGVGDVAYERNRQ